MNAANFTVFNIMASILVSEVGGKCLYYVTTENKKRRRKNFQKKYNKFKITIKNKLLF